MNMQLTYKIYYDNEGTIKTVTTENLTGQHVIVNEEMFNTLNKRASKYEVIEGKIVHRKKKIKPKPTLQFTKEFKLGVDKKCYVVEKNNLYNCVETLTEYTDSFDQDNFSWVIYDN